MPCFIPESLDEKKCVYVTCKAALCVLLFAGAQIVGHVILAQVPAPTAELVYSQCQATMGLVNAGYSIRATGDITDDGHPDAAAIPFLFRSSGRTKTLWEIGSGTKKETTSSNGSKGHHTYHGVNKSAPSTADTVYRLPEFVPAFACGNSSVMVHGSVTYIGAETLDGKTVDHLHVRMADTTVSHADAKTREAIQSYELFVDQQTHLVFAWRRVVFSSEALENHAVLEMRFDDYEMNNSIQVPHVIHRLLNGRPVDTLHVQSIEQAAPLTNDELR